MHEHSLSLNQWADFFCNLHRRGVRLLHSSNEYDSFGLLCDVLTEIRSRDCGVQFKHVVKLAEPSFDDERFDALRLGQKVDAYLSALVCDRLDTVQWMWRRDLDDDVKRIRDMARATPHIAAVFETLKAEGKIVYVGCFPYSVDFASEVSGSKMIDRLIFYRNPLEKDYDHLLEKCIVSGKKVIALRPFAAGMAFQEPTRTAVDLIKYALGHECVAGTVFTATKSEHVDAIFLPNGEDERSRVWLTG